MRSPLASAFVVSLLSLCACGWLGACASRPSSAWRNAMAAAAKEQHAGRFDGARSLAAEASLHATRRKDRDEAQYFIARSFHHSGDHRAERETLLALVASSPNGPRAQRAAFDAVDARIELSTSEAAGGSAPDLADAYAELRATLLRYPNGSGARLGLSRLAEHERRSDLSQSVAQLQALEPALKGTSLHAQLQYEMARSLEALATSQPSEEAWTRAEKAYLLAASTAPYPYGGLQDNALWAAARCALARQAPQQAHGHLNALVDQREVARGASYRRPLMPRALLKMAELDWKVLHNPRRARAELTLLQLFFSKSRLTDDARWMETRLLRDHPELGSVCESATRLVQHSHTSRYLPCLHALCPEVSASARSVIERGKRHRDPSVAQEWLQTEGQLARAETDAACPAYISEDRVQFETPGTDEWIPGVPEETPSN